MFLRQLCSLCILLFALSCSSQSHFEKVLLQNVDTIVLREGQTTNARRVSPIPQLRCVGGSAGCAATPRPNLVICTNVGSQRWECEADFDQRYKFGRLQVSCEGYDHPEDPYVLKDSCGLEYEIDYEYSQQSSQQSYGYSSYEQPGWLSFTNILMFAAIGILVYAIYRNSLDTGATPGVTPGSTAGSTAGATAAPATGTGAGTAAPWGNFMTGMFVGGIANFLFSTVSSLFRPNPYGYRPGYGYRGGASGWGGGRRWFGGGGGFGGGRGFGTGGGFGGGGGFGSGGGGSTSRKSGFGGTTKR